MISHAARIVPAMLRSPLGRRVAMLAPAAAAAYLVVGFATQHWLTYPGSLLRSRRSDGRAPDDAQTLTLTTDEGPVEAWLLPARGEAAGPRPLVVFFHGNGSLIDDLPEHLTGYQDLGCHVLLPEYRGYGRSAGRPGRRRITGDMVRFIRDAVEREDVDADRLVYHGFSIGGGVACAVAEQVRPAAMVLHGTFTSTMDVAKTFAFPAPLVRQRFENLKTVAAFTGPTYIMHGSTDPLISPRHAHLLASVARHPTLRITDHGHACEAMLDAAYWRQIRRWLDDHGLLT